MGHPPKWAPGGNPSHRCKDGQRVNARLRTGPDEGEKQHYKPPKLANPGNIVHCKVGGGLIGSKLAHENEAPFPEALAEFFIRSFCPCGGLVLDCFSGSGTTGAVAIRHGRRFAGCDIRASQVELSRRRIEEEIVAQANGSELPPSP
jgi:site-specific DNA-methyltransferase (adenine-specific)